jgi:hypothetical protein
MLAVKGALFEIEVSSRLKSLPKCVVIPNFKMYSFYLKKVTEIDRLLVTPWAAYAIEAKSFTAVLDGNISDQFWYGRSHATPSKIFSPVLQNFEHIRSLNANFRWHSLPFLKFENVIVVPDSCRIKSNYKNAFNLSRFLDQVTSDSCAPHNYPVKDLLNGLRHVMGGLK